MGSLMKCQNIHQWQMNMPRIVTTWSLRQNVSQNTSKKHTQWCLISFYPKKWCLSRRLLLWRSWRGYPIVTTTCYKCKILVSQGVAISLKIFQFSIHFFWFCLIAIEVVSRPSSMTLVTFCQKSLNKVQFCYFQCEVICTYKNPLIGIS